MEKTILPDYVVNSKAVESKIEEFDRLVEYANKHIQTLESEGIPTDLNTLKDILKDEDSFKKWLFKAEESYIGKIGFLPKEEKKRIHSTFIDLFNRTGTARNSLNGFIFNRQGFEVLQDEEGHLYYNIEKAHKQLEESNRRFFSDKDKEYFSKLQDVYVAFKELQSFEAQEKYVAFSQSETFNVWMRYGFDTESLVRSWEWGKMSDGYLKMMKE